MLIKQLAVESLQPEPVALVTWSRKRNLVRKGCTQVIQSVGNNTSSHLKQIVIGMKEESYSA